MTEKPASFRIELATPGDVAALPAIEREASARFASLGLLSEVLQDETSLADFAAAQRANLLWVARAHDGALVGFAFVELVAGQPHLDELDVLTTHGRQGIGRALVHGVVEWARGTGHRALTLTTFRDVPWNAPFYTRLGFRILAEHEQSAELAAIVRDEASRGPDPNARVVMMIETRR